MLLAAGQAVPGVAVYNSKEKKVEWRSSNLNDVHDGQILGTQVQNGSERQLVNWSQTVDPNVLVQKRILYAELVKGLYKRINKPESDYKQYWENNHYELIPLHKILSSAEQTLYKRYIKSEEKYKCFGVFRKKNTDWNPAAPEWVVAIRGTSKRNLHDFVDNIRISLERLHKSSTVNLLKIVISRLVKDMGFNPKGSNLAVIERGTQPDIHNLNTSLAVTGHSLGAATAMLLAREFALRGYFMDSHFFNPPFATLTAIARFWARQFFSPIFGKKLRDNFSKILLGVSMGVNYYLDDARMMKEQLAEYEALAYWSPYIYLNENDPVCGLYVRHFLRGRLKKARIHQTIDTWYSLGSALLRVTFGDARTFHLMPRAICCIARTQPFSAHRLDNWIRHDVPIIVQPSNLEVELNEEQKLLTLKVVGEDIEEDLVEGEGEEEQIWIQESEWLKEEADDDHQNW